MQSIEKLSTCKFCTEKVNYWDFVDSVYVICLEDRSDRLQKALTEVHRVGLCQANTNIFLAKRSPDGFIAGCWDSHVQVAKHALLNKYTSSMVLEDDFVFDQELELIDLIKQIKQSVLELPTNTWTRLSLGHISWFKMPYSANLDRAASVLTHAQIWSLRGLEWMATHTYDKTSKMFGIQVDGFISLRLKHSYSIRPMVAFQRDEGSDRSAFADIMKPEGLKATEVWIPLLYALGLIFAGCMIIALARFAIGCTWKLSVFPVVSVFILPFLFVWILILQNVF